MRYFDDDQLRDEALQAQAENAANDIQCLCGCPRRAHDANYCYGCDCDEFEAPLPDDDDYEYLRWSYRW